MEHVWEVYEGETEVNMTAWMVDDGYGGGHNGPVCTVCEFNPCHHCVAAEGKNLFDPEQFPCNGPSDIKE